MGRACQSLRIALVFLGLMGCRTGGSASDLMFYGADARRARMTFETELIYALPVGYTGDVSRLYQIDEHKEAIDEAIALQLAHMFGAFYAHTRPFDFTKFPGLPRERPLVSDVRTERVPGQAAARVRYAYEDIVVFKKSLFHGGNDVTLEFLLPKDPHAIYAKGLVPLETARQAFADDDYALEEIRQLKKEGETQVNLCTDLHYNSEDDYWYFWNPYLPGCPRATREATVRVQANLAPMNSTRMTRPVYDKLYGDNGNGEELRITYLVGVDENFRNGDLGVRGFRKAFRLLTEGKGLLQANLPQDYLLPGERTLLEQTPDDRDIRFTVLRDQNRHKTLRYIGDGYRVLLNIYLVDPNTEEFVQHAVDGLRNADVFIYDGHSGLGGYLSVGRLFARRHYLLPLDKYQIFFFNGCSTFSYYNYDFFQLKATPEDPRGYRNLEIVTTATPAFFDRGPGTDAFFIRQIALGERPTWQEMIDTLRLVEGEDSSLIHVNGDEDNH